MISKCAKPRKRSARGSVDEILFRDLAKKSLVGIYLIQDHLFRYTNERMAEIFGYSLHEIIDRMGPEQLVHPEDWPIVDENISRRITGTLGSVHYEFRGIKKDGEIVDIEAYGYGTSYNGRSAVIGTLLDTTKKKQAELMRKQAEQMYRGIFENAVEGIFQSTIDGKMIASNPAMATMLGYDSPEEYIASVSDLKNQHYVEPNRRQIFMDTIEREGLVSGFEAQLYKKNGEIIWAVINARVVRNADGSTRFYEGTIWDITERKKAADRVKSLSDFNQAIIENAPIAIFTLDKTGRVSSVNPALAKLTGLGDRTADILLGLNWLTNPYTIKSGLARHIGKGLHGTPFQLWDFPFMDFKGSKNIFIDFKGVPLHGRTGEIDGLLCIIEETTERVKTREKLMQDTRISAIGRLAAGAAHELNNPLATLVAFTEIATDMVETSRQSGASPPDPEQLAYCLDVVQQQAFRCKFVVNDLLSLSRKDGLEIRNVDVNKLIEDIVGSLDFEHRGIIIERSLAKPLRPARADQSALRQVLVNLIHNAMDAVEGRVNATIQVRTYFDKEMATIEVEDNGIGIPDTILDKIFEPFFTTKETEKGIGLGLSLSLEFVRSMSGDMSVKSEPGCGATFTVRLPVSGSGR